MSRNKDNNRELVELLLKLNIKHAIEDSNFNLKIIDNRIKFYRLLINHLENNKPLFFQKKKLIEYNNKLEEYNNKINDLYNQITEEMDLIEKLQKYI